MSMDMAEYKRIVIALRPSLLSVARRLTGNIEDAEELVNRLFIKQDMAMG